MTTHLLLPKTRTHYALSDLTSPAPSANLEVTRQVAAQINVLIELLNQKVKSLGPVNAACGHHITTSLTHFYIKPHRQGFRVVILARDRQVPDMMLFTISDQDPDLKLIRCWVNPEVITTLIHNLIHEWPN